MACSQNVASVLSRVEPVEDTRRPGRLWIHHHLYPRPNERKGVKLNMTEMKIQA